MRIISNPEKTRIGCLGEQKIQKSVNYRFLKYIFMVEIASGMLIYNGLTGELIYFDSNERDSLINDDLPLDIFEVLVKKWFMVPNEYDEYKLCNQINDFIDVLNTTIKQPKCITQYTILTTTDCNARCFYCYERGRKRINMSHRTAFDVAQYIIKSSGGKHVNFRWFGGEPLYNYEAIDIICKNLRDNKIEYSSSIVSNGYLFDDSLIAKSINSWNVKKVQISLDGTEEVYNRCKAYIYKDTNAFKRVMGNIKRLLESGISVKLRINMDSHNANDLFFLVDELASKFGDYSNLSVYSRLLFDNTAPTQENRKFTERQLLMDNHKKLSNYIKSKGFEVRYTLDGYFRKNQCMADNDIAVVILPDGSLGKCEHFSESDFFGSIYSPHVDDSVINLFKLRRKPENRCYDCPVYPACIRLKKCPDIPDICDEIHQEISIESVRNRIINTYNDYLTKHQIQS